MKFEDEVFLKENNVKCSENLKSKNKRNFQ